MAQMNGAQSSKMNVLSPEVVWEDKAIERNENAHGQANDQEDNGWINHLFDASIVIVNHSMTPRFRA